VTPAVEAGGVELAYDETGDGPAVVLVHGTATPRSVWRELVEQLGDGVRAIAYDRRAYGGSGAPEPYGGTTVGEQADDLAELIEAVCAAPAVVCGHELGALACLDLLVRHAALARAAVLVEPPMLWLAPDGPDAVSELRDAVARGARDGGSGGAVTAYLEHTAGPGALELLGTGRVAAARATPRAFAADIGAAAGWPTGRRELRAIDTPVVVIAGTRSAPFRRRAAAALAELLPRAKLVEVEAGHLAHVEAPADVARAISAACA
jgi:pimeloyl-ACP methyl ester carboxylesterase